MADKIKMTVEGMPELKKAFSEISAAVKNAGLELAGRTAAEIIVQDARVNAPGPHIYQATKEKKPTRILIHIGPDKSHWYYRFTEWGASPHQIKPDGAALRFPGMGGVQFTGSRPHPGMKARPFLRPAFDQNLDKVPQVMAGVFWQLILRFTNGS